MLDLLLMKDKPYMRASSAPRPATEDSEQDSAYAMLFHEQEQPPEPDHADVWHHNNYPNNNTIVRAAKVIFNQSSKLLK